MGIFGSRKPEQNQDGKSPETALRLPAVGSGSAIAIEYKTLGKLFGRENVDWRILDRIRSQSLVGRQIEKFILQTRDGRRVVHFDITDVLASAENPEVEEITDAAMRRQRTRSLAITLPKAPFLLLFTTLTQVGQQFDNKDFRSEDVLFAMTEVIEQRSIKAHTEFTLALSVADWLNILSITGLIEIQSLAAQEIIYDLRAIVDGALKKVGPG